jgi:membrane protease YdiL (CAAX protease family)
MISQISLLLNLALMLAVVASLVLWARTLWAHREHLGVGLADSLLPPQVRQRPFWTPADALLLFGLSWLLIQAILITLARKGLLPATNPGAADSEVASTASATSMVAMTVGMSIAVLLTLAWLRIFRIDAWRQLGLIPSWKAIELGLWGALMILPPVMLISAAASLFVTYEHPVLTSLIANASPAMFVATFIGTAVATPVFEELLLRGLLQGSLQGLADREPDLQESPDPKPNDGVAAGATDVGAGSWVPQSHWPVIVTSLLFAILHLGQGAAPIPLFFLSLGLGYLYRQSGSLVAPIVVHMVLNALTLTMEILKLWSV